MGSLPADIYRQIFDFLPQKTLLNCRSVSRNFCQIVTKFAFRHKRLEAARDVSGFVQVARSEALRAHVREVTIDTWVGPDFEYRANEDFRPPRAFFRALPFLQCFGGLKVLNLRFSKWCGNEDDDYTSIEETYDFRFVVLDVVFRCLVGTWSAEHQKEQESSLITFDSDSEDEESEDQDDDEEPGMHDDTSDAWPHGFSIKTGTQTEQPIVLSTLTISNLADYNDPRFTSSDAFKQVISSKDLTELKLLIATEEDDASPESAIQLPEKYEFYDTLPKTWLSPPLAQNLRVLSLFGRDYWGWNPKMDFRAVNPGTGPNSGFPNLRVLALGNYVFSHEWQIDWVASLGRQNGRGGLEELYLDDCPIMWQARTLTPLDSSTTTCESINGDSIEFSNEGYPKRDVMISHTNWNPEKFSYNLRWHRVLDFWKDNMIGLKVFKMGHGSWDDNQLNLVIDSDFGSQPGSDTRGNVQDAKSRELTEREEREFSLRIEARTSNVFLNYTCPSPPDSRGQEQNYSSTYRYGVGLQHRREHILQYIHFDIGLGPTAWIERDESRNMVEEQGLQAYEAAKRLDEEAYNQLLEVTQKKSLL